MHNNKEASRNSRRTGAGLGLLVAMSIGLGACGAGTTTRATTAGSTAPAADGSGQGAASQAANVPVGAPNQPAAASVHPTPPTSPASAATPAKATSAASKAATGPTQVATTAAPVTTPPAPPTSTLPARRQPSSAEVSQIIGKVHALVPLFTPTAAQIAVAGNDVCSAFDQGKTVAQVKAAAMKIAGVYAALIPAGIADTALRTIVTTYCPGYLSKLG